MNTAGAATGGIGAIVLGLAVLMYQIGRWKGGDPTPKIHFFAGVAIATLLFLGGGILGAMGGATAALGDGVGRYALEAGTNTVAASGGHRPLTGGEKVGISGVVTGLCLLALYLGLIKSGRYDLKKPIIRGALCGVWLGTSAGLIGLSLGLIRTSGATVGDILITHI